MAARADAERARTGVEQNRHLLPVSLVHLPELRALRDDRAPVVVRVEEPVLEHDHPGATVNRRIRGRRARELRVTVDGCDDVPRRAASHVEAMRARRPGGRERAGLGYPAAVGSPDEQVGPRRGTARPERVGTAPTGGGRAAARGGREARRHSVAVRPQPRAPATANASPPKRGGEAGGPTPSHVSIVCRTVPWPPGELHLLHPLLILLVLLLLMGTVVVLGRWRGGRYLRAIVTRVPFLRGIFSRMSIAALERSNPELASAMKKMQTSAPRPRPSRPSARSTCSTPSERRAYPRRRGRHDGTPETTNRQQRRRLERSALPGGGRSAGGKGKSKRKR